MIFRMTNEDNKDLYYDNDSDEENLFDFELNEDEFEEEFRKLSEKVENQNINAKKGYVVFFLFIPNKKKSISN